MLLLTVFVCQTRTIRELCVPVSHADFYICGKLYYTHSVVVFFLEKRNCEDLSVVTPNGPKQKLKNKKKIVQSVEILS